MTRRKSLLTTAAALTATLLCAHAANAVSVSVSNHSFEAGALGDAVVVPSWTTNHIVGNHAVRLSAAPGGFQATDGTQLVTFRTGGGSPNGIRSFSSLRQTLSEAIDTSQIYTLTVDVGHYDPSSFGGPAGLELYWDNAGTPTTIAATAAIPGSFGNKTYNLQVSGTELAGLSGQTVGIRLFTTQEGTNFHVAYDNVRLDKVASPTPQGTPTPITVPDFSFEISGNNNHSWTLGGNPVTWGGNGWPMSAGSYDLPASDGSRFGVNATYQLLPDTFVEGATYVLTVDHALRFNNSTQFDTASIMFFRQNQHPGDLLHIAGPTIGILDGALDHGQNPVGVNLSDWRTMTLTYVATAADHGQRIGLFLQSASAHQATWDNVRLTVDFAAAAEVVPEPSTYALGLIGLAGLGLLVWRKRKSKA